MEQNQKLQILESFLRKNGMSLDDPDVKRFFFEPRKTRDAVENENFKKKLAYGPIEPTIYKIDPIQFENSGYFRTGKTSSLMDWFLYANASDNPLVFDNLGKDQIGIRKSFEERRNYRDPLLIDSEGKIYNSEDGNHRLLSLIINEFVEYAGARTQEERTAIREKYSIIAECSFPHDKELCALLEKEKAIYVDYLTPENSDMFIPEAVREFRANHKGATDLYLASYDPKTKRYKYDFNGEKFVGTCDELKNFLLTKQKSKVPTMLWSDGKFSYASCNNFVVMSKNKELIESKFHDLAVDKNTKNTAYKPYLIVCNVDSGTYDITVPAFTVDEGESRLKTQMINFGTDFANNPQNARFFELCNVSKDHVLQECHDGEVGFVLAIPEMRFRNISKEDYEYVMKILSGNEKFVMEPLKVMEQAVKFDGFAEKLFEILPIVDDANETLLHICRGLKANGRISGSDQGTLTQAKQTFSFGRTIAQWGYGKVKAGVEDYLRIEGDAIVMPDYVKIERPETYFEDLEKVYANENYLSSFESKDFATEQVEILKEKIEDIEEIKLKSADREIAKIADEIISIIKRDVKAGEELCNVVETSSDSTSEKE